MEVGVSQRRNNKRHLQQPAPAPFSQSLANYMNYSGLETSSAPKTTGETEVKTFFNQIYSLLDNYFTFTQLVVEMKNTGRPNPGGLGTVGRGFLLETANQPGGVRGFFSEKPGG